MFIAFVLIITVLKNFCLFWKQIKTQFKYSNLDVCRDFNPLYLYKYFYDSLVCNIKRYSGYLLQRKILEQKWIEN